MFGGLGGLFGGDKAKKERDLKISEESCRQLQMSIDELNSHAEERRIALARLTAEEGKFRARTQQELTGARAKAIIPLLREFLSITNDFEQSRANVKADTAGEGALTEQFEQLYTRLIRKLGELGAHRLESIGQEFDPELHEAVSMVPSEEFQADTVCVEYRSGWVLSAQDSEEKHVLQHALVCVSSGPAAASA